MTGACVEFHGEVFSAGAPGYGMQQRLCVVLIDAGRSLYEVQRIVGRSRIVTRQRYAYLSSETLLERVCLAGIARRFPRMNDGT